MDTEQSHKALVTNVRFLREIERSRELNMSNTQFGETKMRQNGWFQALF